MERKDAIILLLVLGGGGYAAYANWDKICSRLSLDDLQPHRIKAIDLAKKANSFDPYLGNWEVLAARQKNGEIEVAGDPWVADRIDDRHYRVFCAFVERGKQRRWLFQVDLVARVVTVDGDASAGRPAPR